MAQETWIKIVRAAPQYRGEGKCLGWILGIARNVCLSEMRRHSSFEIADEAIETAAELGREAWQKQLDLQEQVETIKALIAELPDTQRAVLMMWIGEDLSYEQIAGELNLTVGAVKSQLFRARQSLEKAMKA